MTELLHVAALLPATLGVCCTAARRRATPELVAAIVMLVVMADLALGVVSVPPITWTAVLVATALSVVWSSRRREDRSPVGRDAPGTGRGPAVAAVAPITGRHTARGMSVMTAAGALVMAGLASLMSPAVPGSADAAVTTASSAAVGGHHAVDALGGVLPAAVLLAAAVYTGVVVWGVVRGVRERRRRLETAELASMATSVALMALVVAV
ncbi:hypothetical protein ELQ92_13545 [Labedella populi]|uniref:Uncharacterized protein n=1 Tax=Labedella populi TaxID=2498850 RepID=A0A3S4AZ67_9MICO|nr:hypothetical protein [Labedella populi]RWZ59278.1 hypothetical protein ELQ92_13545 [Labedella populi]